MPSPPNGVLPHQEIVRLIQGGVITATHADNIRTASYDMRLGDEYYLYDKDVVNGDNIRLRQPHEVITVPPNGLLLCTMHETIAFPRDIVGHLSLKVKLLMSGLIMASQSQIDAGYVGQIFALLYNLSHKDVCLNARESVLRLEMVRLEEPSDIPYSGQTSSTGLKGAIQTPLFSSLVKIGQDAHDAVESVEKAKRDLQWTQALGLIMVAALGAIATVDSKDSASAADLRALQATVSRLDGQIAILNQKIGPSIPEPRTLNERVMEIEKRLGAKAHSTNLIQRVSQLEKYVGIDAKQQSLDERVQQLETTLSTSKKLDQSR